MAATIRLKRVGRKKQAAFRIVVADDSTAVEGPSIERLGMYQPRTSPSVIEIDAARTLHWLRQGAMPTDTVRSLLRKTGVWQKFHAGTMPEELEEAVVVLGPAPDRRQTSQRPTPEPPPPPSAPASSRKGQAKKAESAAETGETTAEEPAAGTEGAAAPEASSAAGEEPEASSPGTAEAEAEVAEAESQEPKAAAEGPEAEEVAEAGEAIETAEEGEEEEK